MFFKNKALLKTALMLMVGNADDLALMSNINKCFESVKLDDIPDVEIKELCATVKRLSSDIQIKNIRTPETARAYIAHSSLKDDVKQFLLSMKTRFSEEQLSAYNVFFTKMRTITTMEHAMDDLNQAYEEFKLSGIDMVADNLDTLQGTFNKMSDVMVDIAKSTDNDDIFVIDVDHPENSKGLEKLEEAAVKEDKNRIKTGMWIDNLTGGGFISTYLYVVSSYAGGFKSGFLQNVVERISCYMDPDKLLLKDNVSRPAIYYLNLEMTSMQILKRKLGFYGVDYDELKLKIDESEGEVKFKQEVHRIAAEKGGRLPVIYAQAKMDTVTVQDVKARLLDQERNGYQIIGLVIDYLDLLKYNTSMREIQEFKTGIVMKAQLIKNLAKEMNIPVITAAQLNRSADGDIKSSSHRAAKEDLVLKMSSANIAKSYNLKSVPDQIYMCLMQTINGKDYFSIVVDKDRDHDAKWIEPEGDNKPSTTKDNEEKMFRKRARVDTSRVLYVSPINNFKISDVYSNTIRNFEDSAEDMLIQSIEEDSISDEELQ